MVGSIFVLEFKYMSYKELIEFKTGYADYAKYRRGNKHTLIYP